MKPEKEWVINHIQEIADNNETLILTGFSGLSSSQMSSLRKNLKEISGGYVVTKNRLLRKLIEKRVQGDLFEFRGSQTGVAYAPDPVVLAKVLKKFSAENEAFQLKGGALGERVLKFEDVDALAKLPSREVLLGKLVGALQSPIYGLVYVLKSQLISLVMVLSRILDEKKKTQES
ncbi:MAG: 50S ribosomal protein L10 [Chlamydiota bacterium]|nr:50S ribosomal protein L10 [Chlamydiota bacterium]